MGETATKAVAREWAPGHPYIDVRVPSVPPANLIGATSPCQPLNRFYGNSPEDSTMTAQNISSEKLYEPVARVVDRIVNQTMDPWKLWPGVRFGAAPRLTAHSPKT